jgi:hypothetical protein
LKVSEEGGTVAREPGHTPHHAVQPYGKQETGCSATYCTYEATPATARPCHVPNSRPLTSRRCSRGLLRIATWTVRTR